ncbi:MAG: DUF1501 domain-containing protein [Singulisphaera sp.]
MTIQHCSRPRYSRRTLLHIGCSGFLGLSLADLLRALANPTEALARAQGVILIWLGGGPATIDMWDPKPDAPPEIRGDFTMIDTAIPGIPFTSLVPRTAKVVDRGVLVRSLHHNVPDHVPGAQYLMTGNKPSAAVEHPSLGSLAAKLRPTTAGMPPYFTIGEAANSGAGFLGAAYDPFRFRKAAGNSAQDLNGVVLPASMNREQFERRRHMQDAFNTAFVARQKDSDIVPTLAKFQQDSHDILTSNRIGHAFDLANESPATSERYGTSEIGRGALVARRLIEAGTRFVTVGTEGWDTHTGNFASLRSLLPPLDQALAGLIEDLDERGLLTSTLVLCGGEFGRTPLVNKAVGRDHWSQAMTWFLAGGGLKRGCVYGSTDARGFDPLEAPCSPDDLAATALHLLGFSPDERVHTTAGRPIKLFQHGTVLNDVVA